MKKEVGVVDLLKLQCKCCNAPLNYSSATDRVMCDHCGMTYIVTGFQPIDSSQSASDDSSKTEGEHTKISFVEVGVKPILVEEIGKYIEKSKAYGFKSKDVTEYTTVSDVDGYKKCLDRATWFFAVLSLVPGQSFNLDLGRMALNWEYYSKYKMYKWIYPTISYGNKTHSYLEYEEKRVQVENDLTNAFPSGFDVATPSHNDEIRNKVVEQEDELQDYFKAKGIAQVHISTIYLPLVLSVISRGDSVAKNFLNMFTSDANHYQYEEGTYGLWVYDDVELTLAITSDSIGNYVDVKSLTNRLEAVQHKRIVEDISNKIYSLLSDENAKDSVFVEIGSFSASCGNNHYSYSEYNMESIMNDETKFILMAVVLNKALFINELSDKWNIVSFKEKHDFEHKERIDYVVELHPRIEKHIDRVYESWE